MRRIIGTTLDHSVTLHKPHSAIHWTSSSTATSAFSSTFKAAIFATLIKSLSNHTTATSAFSSTTTSLTVTSLTATSAFSQSASASHFDFDSYGYNWLYYM